MHATSLLVVLIASAAAGVATIAILPQITAIPRERWATSALGPIFSQSALSALTPGALSVVFRAPPPWALAIAAGGGALAITRLVIRYAPIRAVKRLTPSLARDAERPRAMAAMAPTLDRARPPSSNAAALGVWAQAGLIGAAYLIDADEPEAARPVLERMSGLTFKGASFANHALLWAHVEIFANDMPAARSALESIQRPISLSLLEAHAEVLDALALACEGHAPAALARLDAWRFSADWYGKLRLITRVVANGVLGEDGARMRAEAELGRRFGPRALASARRLADEHAEGPARPQARPESTMEG